VKKKHQFVLILGIINVILPVIPVLSHRGWFGMVWDGGKWLEVYLGCSYNDFITICFIIGGNYYWKHTIKEGIYKACKDGAAAFVHWVRDAFTLSICF